MMTDQSDIESFGTYLETLGLDSATQKMEPGRTLRDNQHQNTIRAIDAARTLPRLNLNDTDADTRPTDLRIIGTLGEGGMGIVRLANQLSLDRDVAVKTTREGTNAQARAAEMLLQEAYVTGFLEHPNIIPIYTIGRDDKGAPLIVMKCVEGSSWLELIEQEESQDRDLSKHIEILIQVCNAVRFAHSRGIIHRDIKPENVMIGNFGEVYLLDWGIALSLTDKKPLLPHRKDTRGLCGSPYYMAPEMAAEEIHDLDECTDVYLLGATLHQILTGEPRHNGTTLLNVLFNARQSKPAEYDDSIPAELATITNKACHRNKESRFDSVEAFSDALHDFLRHRESVSLSTSAEDKRAYLQRLLAAAEPDAASIHDTYGECRFGFHQAQRIWADNQQAIIGMQKCLESMADYYLDQSNLEATQSCIDEMSAVPTHLEKRASKLADRIAEDEQDLQRLKRLESNLDLRTAMTSRSLLTLFIGIIWTATSMYAVLQQGLITPDEEMRRHMEAGFRNIGIVLLGVLFFRKRLFANRVNRRLIYLLMTMAVSVAFLRWSAWYIGEGLILARTADFVLYVTILMSAGLISDKRICFIALPFAAAAIIGILWPSFLLHANTAATALTFGAFAWIWRPTGSATSTAL